MTKNITYIILIFTFFGCNNNQNKQNNNDTSDSLIIVNFQDTNVVLDPSNLNIASPVNDEKTDDLELDPYQRRVSPEDLQIKGERYYFNDAPFTGISAYSKNKIIQFEIMFVNGFKEGTSKWFYVNGNVKSEINFKKNKQDGPFKIFSQDGIVIESGIFKDGKKI